MLFLSLTMSGTMKSNGRNLQFDMLRLVWKNCAASRGTENDGPLIFGRLMMLDRQYSCFHFLSEATESQLADIHHNF